MPRKTAWYELLHNFKVNEPLTFLCLRGRASCLLSGLMLLLPLVTLAGNALAAEPVSGDSAKPLKQMLEITWKRGTNLPQGFQDSDGGILGDRLITVGGFCSGGLDEDNRLKPGIYPRGFLNKAWQLSLQQPKAQWQPLPDFPGAPRQALSCAKVGDQLFFWGGFSYSKPYCYADGWRLSRTGETWQWDRLPDFPWQINSAAMAVLGSKIFACGGSDYNAEAFFTDADRSGRTPRLGARLLVFDTQNTGAGWRELPQCPGTPRWVHTMTAHDGKLYVIGGASGNVSKGGVSYGYCSIVDNWAYDVAKRVWIRLADLPISSGNFPRSSQNLYRNRYILLPGGHQYAHVLSSDGTVQPPYGKASTRNAGSGLHNDVFVYDIVENQFGKADSLPIDNNLPMTVVEGDRIYLLGGETGGGVVDGEYYGHHPDLLLIGQIRVSGPER